MATTTIPRPSLAAAANRPGRLRSLVRGHADDPAWARPLLIALLVGTLIAYLIDLTASGYSNSFYSAAIEAGTKSWKAFFFGSIDSSNFITVDKPPASLWVMELSTRIFGFSSASMLVPQVLEGVLSVALLAAAVRRWFGAGAGLLAGLALAVTPVAALMFRFNNPDALMVCLMTASAYCLVRALEGERTRRWMLGVGALLGFAFLAKMLEAFLIVPGFALVYLVAAPVSARRRVGDLLLGGAAMLAACGWWVAIVELWPAGSRPMIDGSSDNSVLNLILGYNGLGRLSGGTGGGGGNFSGATGPLRLFNDLMGGQASWLLPAAGIVLVGGMAWRMRAPRTDRLRAALMLWGSWLLVSGAVFSFSSGVIHTYYTVELAPAIAAVVGIGAAVLWQRRERLPARIVMALIVAATAAWALIMLARTPSWETWLTPLVILTGAAAIAGLLAPAALRRRLSVAVAVCAVTACLAVPVAYTVQTLGSAHTGSVPSAGPTASDSQGGFGGGGPGGAGGFGRRAGGFGRGRGAGGAMGGTNVSSALITALKTDASNYRWVAATSGSQSAASLELASGGRAVMAIGGFSGNGGNLSLAQFKKYVKAGEIHYYVAGGGFGGGGLAGGGSAPSASGASASSRSSIASLFGSSSARSGSSAGPPSSHSGFPSGSGAPSGEGFPGGGSGSSGQRSGLPSGAGVPGGPGGGQSTQAITSWVKGHYKAVTIGGQTVYDLTQPKS